MHKDWWTDRYDQAEAVDNFRFKAYLKSNLQNLVPGRKRNRDLADRKGTERTFAEQEQAKALFPEKVNRVYTRGNATAQSRYTRIPWMPRFTTNGCMLTRTERFRRDHRRVIRRFWRRRKS